MCLEVELKKYEFFYGRIKTDGRNKASASRRVLYECRDMHKGRDKAELRWAKASGTTFEVVDWVIPQNDVILALDKTWLCISAEARNT